MPRKASAPSIASGTVDEAFTSENLRLAYGGRVEFLQQQQDTYPAGNEESLHNPDGSGRGRP